MESILRNNGVVSVLWGCTPGGVAEYAKNISKLEEVSGFCFTTIIVQKKGWRGDFSGFKGVNYKVIYFDNFFKFSWIFELIKLINLESPKIIFAHSFNAAIVSALIKFFLRKKVLLVCSYHGVYIAPSRRKQLLAPIYNGLTYFIYSNISTGIICVSEFSKQELTNKGINKNKIKVVHNGINQNPVYKKHSNVNFEKNSDELLIGIVCRLVPLKGVDILIHAMKDVSSARLLIVGDGPMRSELERASESINEKVLFVGNQDNVDDWLKIIDIFILPSFVENHSISILEAMRQGKAIITTNIGGNPESISDGVDGILVPPGNIKALTRSIKYLQDNPNKIEEFGVIARKKFLENFTKKIMIDNTKKYFDSLFH